MNKLKKLLALIICAVMTAALLPEVAFGEEEKFIDDPNFIDVSDADVDRMKAEGGPMVVYYYRHTALTAVSASIRLRI